LSREAKVEEEFYRLTKNVLEKRSYILDGVKFGDPEPQYPVDSGVSDLMIPIHTPKPLLIAEFKRKIQTAKGLKVIRDFDPLSSKVITQALTYAVQCGAPFFITTNGKTLALFTTPERGDPFRIDRHRLLVKEIQLNEETVEEVLRVVAKWSLGIKVERTPLDWTFIVRLRSFVEWLSRQMLKAIDERLKADDQFKERYEEFTEEIGGIARQTYSREAAYILMNKIIFYKILERYYGKLPILKPIPPKNGADFSARLKEFFEKAIETTEDFKPIFTAGFYDEAPLPDDPDALDEINAFIEDMETYKLEEVGSDVVGFIYERLIPEEERHQLGQFYTPPQIAELIVKWAVREPTDRVMDPGCGSGTFLVKAYGRLRQFRPLASESVHREILSQLYAIDINPFPAHITAMNLAMRDVGHPASEMNIVVNDFFKVLPNQKVFAPYTIKTAKGEVRREILIPVVDAVAANPPYTRWTEIPEKTQEAIKKRIGETLKRYNLTARVRQGIEPGIYLHFIIWAHEFLKPGGRLGMIISDSWLQTDYGIDFGRFLLDHFKVKAVIDISARVFPIPLIGTCIILLEKEPEEEARDENQDLSLP
jgi:type I restriction-modification system DNA methylase subunit